jgi:hypothetical protein
MLVLKLRLRLAENMPHPNSHWWQQEMFDASCGLDTFYFRRIDDNKTATSLLSPQHSRSGDIRKKAIRYLRRTRHHTRQCSHHEHLQNFRRIPRTACRTEVPPLRALDLGHYHYRFVASASHAWSTMIVHVQVAQFSRQNDVALAPCSSCRYLPCCSAWRQRRVHRVGSLLGTLDPRDGERKGLDMQSCWYSCRSLQLSRMSP